MRRLTLIAMVSTMALAPAAEAGGKASTKVTFDAVFFASGQTHWSGDVISSQKACKNRRKVLIYRVRPGADAKVGATRSFKGMSDNGYYWTYFEQGTAKSGKYYVKVKPTDKCQGDRSNTLELER